MTPSTTAFAPDVSTNTSCTIFPTRLGWMALAGRGDLISDLWFGYEDALTLHEELARRNLVPDEFSVNSTSTFADARELLTAYAQGRPVDFTTLKLDLGRKTPFQQAIIQATRRIPHGQTNTYGELATRTGYPKAARAAGSVMSSNRIPLIIPCHRVLGSGGKLTGFSAPGQLVMKQHLLDLEAGCPTP